MLLKPNGLVDLFDHGPQVEPKKPAKPAPLAVDDPEFEPKKAAYDEAVRLYRAAKAEWDEWAATKHAPRKVEMAPIDARHAIDTDPQRWHLTPRRDDPAEEETS